MKTMTDKKIEAVKTGSLFLIILSFLFMPSILEADGIISATMNPTNPGWGQQFELNISYCIDQYNAGALDVAISTSSTPQAINTAGQVFLVSNLGIDVHSTNPNPAGNIGYNIPIPSPFLPNCAECGGSTSGMMRTAQYTLTMPNAADMGSASCGSSITNLNMIAGFENNIMSWSSAMPVCDYQTLNWPIPTPAQSVSVHKNVQGTLALVGDKVLYSVDYTYGNGSATITDPIPGGGCLALIDYGPNPAPSGGSVSAPALGSTSGTVSWTMPSTTYTKSGTVWILLQMTCAIATGTVISNTATGTNGSANSSSTANLTVGTVGLSLDKEQSINSFLKLPSSTVTITYYLNYQINGNVLKAIRMLDDAANGAYSSSPPPGWKFLPDMDGSGQTGIWTISDACNTGDRIITGSVSAPMKYPALLLDDPTPANVQMCNSGIIESDVMINPGNYTGSDAFIIIRSNGLTGNAGYEYGLLLSIDTAPSGGYVGIQKCGGGTCSWPAYVDPASLALTGNTWYRVKILISGNGFTFQAKVWQVGQPEPIAYQLTWTDTTSNTDPNWECPDHGGTNSDWRPGVGEQGNDQDGTTQDSYNNFMTYNTRVSANTALFDTIPAGLTYQGSNPAGSQNGSMLTWNLGNISDQSGSYTWWASTSACNQSFTNVAGISGTQSGGPAAQFSNQTVFNVVCASPTVTVTPTPTPNFTISKTASKTTNIVNTDQLTFNIVICNNSGAVTQAFTVYDDWSSSSGDQWQYLNPYYTSPVGNGIYSLTANIGVPSAEWTQFIFQPTPTGFTGCFTFQMYIGNAQSNNTCNWHNNASLAWNGQPSVVSTVILSDNCSIFTVTPSPTINTGLLTTSPTPSQTYTITTTWTPTPAISGTSTNTVTSTVTKTYTMTITFTPPPVLSGTSTSTPTWTRTNTPTYTYTPTWTMTLVVTNASTSTPTPTWTQTNTPTVTGTYTPIDTATTASTPTVTNTQNITGATSITKTASAACAGLNDLVTYSISYINVGATTINAYAIWDTIPAQMNVVSISGSGSNNAGVINWTFSNPLGPGQSGVAAWVGQVTSNSGTIVNTAMDSQGAISGASFFVCSPTATFTSALTPIVTATNTPTTSATYPVTPITSTATVTATPTLVIQPTPATSQMPCQTITLFQNIIYPSQGQYLTIHYSLYTQMSVVIIVYDRNGILVKTIANDQESGDVNASWDGTNDSGKTVASGIYLIYIRLGQCKVTEKVAVVR